MTELCPPEVAGAEASPGSASKATAPGIVVDAGFSAGEETLEYIVPPTSRAASERLDNPGPASARTQSPPPRKRHRGERWGANWKEGAAPLRGMSHRGRRVRRKRPPLAEEANGAGSSAHGRDKKKPSRASGGQKCRKRGTTPSNQPGITTGPSDTGQTSEQKPVPQTSAMSLAASEASAEASVAAGDFSQRAMLLALRKLQIPANFTRKNVMPKGTTFVQGLLLGLYVFGGNVGVSSATTKHPWLSRLLVGALRRADPDFRFTSIQLNYNYASRPHIDKNNLGSSCVIGLGDYTGGELWVDDDEGDVPYTLDDDEDVSAFYTVGKQMHGRLLQIKDKWTMFDGNRLHFTQPFEGERYSIIFFCCDRYSSTPATARDELIEAGFDFDWSAAKLEATLEQKRSRRLEIARLVAKERAKDERERLLSRGRCIGRVWADGWGLRCTGTCSDGEEFCGSHLDRERWRTHGRFDGGMPAAKQKEMEKMQNKNLREGKLPPVSEGLTLLVTVAGWPPPTPPPRM